MLILTRKPGESIRIGDDIVIYVKSISGKTVRLGITAPQSVPVYREELLEGPPPNANTNGKTVHSVSKKTNEDTAKTLDETS